MGSQADNVRSQLTSEVERARSLHNALSTALAMVDADTSEKMRQDPTIKAVLAPR
jgi:hypothetical protein